MSTPSTRQIRGRETILKKWLSDGIPWNTTNDGELLRDSNGELTLAYFPKDTKALAEWSGSQYGAALANTQFEIDGYPFRLLELKPLSRSTLDKIYHISTRNVCLNLVRLLKEKAQFQLADANKSNSITKLRQKLAHLEQINAIQEIEIRDLRLKVRHQSSEANKNERRYKYNEEQLHIELEIMREENAKLTKTLAKVTQLKPIRNSKK